MEREFISTKNDNTINKVTDINYLTRNLYTYEYIKPKLILNKIQLNEKEIQIFTIIKNILNKNNKKTVCRVAGGWVRDKLLARDNQDIDIALDDMSGEQLAKLINDELYPGEEKFGVVSQNCEKSKHLETATMKICDTFIDFVNLRSEKYSEQSRVPIIDIGTPEEDARRRDITINSMFYNINTETVEDFLNSGIKDLSDGLIKTPLDPEITFADDPLRILRVIRFAVRFQFELDPQIKVACMKSEIKSALYKKISNERIAKELSLMLEGNKPQCAIYLLYEFKLLDAVMKLPLGIKEIENNLDNLLTFSFNYILVGSMFLESEDYNSDKIFFNKYLFKINENNFKNGFKNNVNNDFKNDIDLKELKKLFYLNLLTLSFKNYFTKIGKETLKASVVIIRESLKLPNDYVKEISIIHDYVDVLSDFINTSNNVFDRLSSSRIVRKIKSNYLHKLTPICVCYDYIRLFMSNKIDFINQNKFIDYVNEEPLLNSIIQKYQNWYDYLEKENLINIDNLEPLIKGDKIVELIGVSGKGIGVLIELLIEEQIVNSELTYESAVELLKLKKEELNLTLESGKKKKK